MLEDCSKMTEAEVLADFAGEWQADPGEVAGFKVLIAYCSVGDYGCDSSAWYLLKKGRELFEVHGSHCSCMGFEGQFSPEKTTKAYLKSDKFSFSCGGYDGCAAGNKQAAKDWIAANL